MIALWASAALAADGQLHGHLKSFFIGSLPYDLFEAEAVDPALQDQVDALAALSGTEAPNLQRQLNLLVDQLNTATGQGVADFRLKGTLDVGDPWRFEVHHAVSALGGGSGAGGLAGAGSGVALTAPELVDLTWQPDLGDGLTVRGRTDRLTARLSVPNLDVTVGRQPVTFGSGLVFTPMDVVNPFSAATIDTEYKPGIDAVRMDGYAGMAGRLTGVVAWAAASPIHDPDREDVTAEDLILALNGQATVGVTDVQLLAGAVRAEGVFGAGFVSSVGPVGVHGDATVTLPGTEAVEEDPFVRAVVGADWRPTGTSTLSSEAYYQGLGADSPDGYLDVLTGPRASRGEIWQAGRWYASLAWAQEITPLTTGSLALVGNLADPSALVSASFSWSVADNATAGLGAFAGAGRRPEVQTVGYGPDLAPVVPGADALGEAIQSEFGLYPTALFANLAAYF